MPIDYSIKTAEAYRKRRNTVLRALGGKCVRCGFDDPRALQIDHVKGGGCNAPFREYRKAVKIIGALPGVYQLLCANCNWIKRAERNENRRANGRGGLSQTELQKARKAGDIHVSLPLGACTDCGFPVDASDVDMNRHLRSLYHLHSAEIKLLLAQPKLNHAEIGRHFGVSRERIRQIAALLRENPNS